VAFRWIPLIDETVVKLVSIVLSSAFDVYEQAFGERDDTTMLKVAPSACYPLDLALEPGRLIRI